MDYVGSGASISGCGTYRYRLWRTWEDSYGERPQNCVFVMLNPSTADGSNDDPTIRRCVNFAKAFGYKGMEVVNLFAWRATDPKDLLKLYHDNDPVGIDNQRYFEMVLNDAAIIIAAWGAHGSHLGQDETAMGWMSCKSKIIHALGLTKDGHPRHPLYLRADSKPVRFSGRLPTPSNREE